MRYVRTVLIPEDGGLHPVDRRLFEESAVTRELLHNVNLLDDGTAVALYQLSGDVDRVREILDDPSVYDFQLSEGGDRVTVYLHFEPTETIVELLSVFRRHRLVLDTPLEYTTRGGLAVLIVGERAVMREALSEIPDGIRLKLERTGDYGPEAERLYSLLTTRQRETLETAIEVGYYRVPREATQGDVARELGCSDATVGEHLRKIEATVLPAITPR